MFQRGRLYIKKDPPGFRTRWHWSIQRRHHSRYSSSRRLSLTCPPYSFPRLNGGSANTVSIDSSSMYGKMSRQSPWKRDPNPVLKTGTGASGRIGNLPFTGDFSSNLSLACLMASTADHCGQTKSRKPRVTYRLYTVQGLMSN